MTSTIVVRRRGPLTEAAVLASLTVFAMSMQTHAQAPMTVTSSAFNNHDAIPREYTCDGDAQGFDISFQNVPSNAKSLVVVVHDPDSPDPSAPRPQGFTHFVVYDVPSSVRSLSPTRLPEGAKVGVNDANTAGYTSPCPKIGRHRYVTTVYALDEVLPDLGAAHRADVLRAMKGHVIAQAELVGTYQRTR